MRTEDMDTTELELDICHLEGMLHITRDVQIPPWDQEKTEGHPDAVNDGSILVEVSTQLVSTK